MTRLALIFSMLFSFLAVSAPISVGAAEGGRPAIKKSIQKAQKLKVKARKKFNAVNKKRIKTRANPQRIIRTIRSSDDYQAQHNSSGSEQSVFSSSSVSGLHLASSKALIVNQSTGETLYAKSTNTPTPIASITKLMTAMVMLDLRLPMDEMLTVSEADVDTLKNTTSRLRVGTTLSRREMLQLALMSSENRAASVLARTTPIGLPAFIAAMNRKALELGMSNSRFADPTGLNSDNVSTAEDLVKMVKAAYQYDDIRQNSTAQSHQVPVAGLRNPVEFRNTNVLVRNGTWDIGLSKTGYISEAGRCLVMQAQIAQQPLIIVLLDSYGKLSRIGDAQRIRKWIESSGAAQRRA